MEGIHPGEAIWPSRRAEDVVQVNFPLQNHCFFPHIELVVSLKVARIAVGEDLLNNFMHTSNLGPHFSNCRSQEAQPVRGALFLDLLRRVRPDPPRRRLRERLPGHRHRPHPLPRPRRRRRPPICPLPPRHRSLQPPVVAEPRRPHLPHPHSLDPH